MTFKRQRNRKTPPKQHMHYMITCGQCEGEFSICGYGGFPCFVICPICGVRLVFWQG